MLSGQAGANHNPYAYGSSSSTSSPAPPAAFVPSLKILKRPSNNAGSAHSASSQAARDQQKKTLKDRERAYNEARNRIFGASSGSAPTSVTPSGASSPVAKAVSPTLAAVSPSTSAQGQDLAASLENLDLDLDKNSKKDTASKTAGKDASRSGSPAPGKLDRTSNPGRQRTNRAGGTASPSQSTPVSSRPSTPSSTIIREPVNPPSSADKNSSAKVHMQARGFSTTKKPKVLSPAATAFVPGSFSIKQEQPPAKKQTKKQAVEQAGSETVVS